MQATDHSPSIRAAHRGDAITQRIERRRVTALFADRDSAERAFGVLARRGYDEDDIDVLMSERTRDAAFRDPAVADSALGHRALETGGIDAAFGGALGAITAAIASMGTAVAVPGLGLAVAGPIASASAGTGAGGIAAALIGWGIPDERMRDYEAGIERGDILLAVNARCDDDAKAIEEEWKASRGEYLYR
jgi:hypothetical protein